MTIKKILSLILLFFISASIFVPTASAIQNTNYSFLEWWVPNFIDHPYDLSYSHEWKSLNLKGTLYPKYNNALINFVPYYIPLKNESSYHGLAWLTALVFVETKKLQQWTNRLVGAKYYSEIDKKFISWDTSPFGVDIDCDENWSCEVFAYAWLNYIFWSDSSNFHYSLKNQTFTQRQRVKVENYKIDKNTDQDFMLLLNFEYSQTRNPDTNYEDWRIKIKIETETKPWSGVMKKTTDATFLSNTFISYLYRTTWVWHPSIELSFLDYRNVFALDATKIKDDTEKLRQKIYFNNWDSSFYESYYRSMKWYMYEYLLELWFKMKDPTKSDLENAWIDTNANPFDSEKMRKGETDFVFKECWNLEILCHIQNAVGYLVYKLWQIISAIFSPIISAIKNIWNWFADIIKSIFSWVWDGIRWFFQPIFEPIYNFFKWFFNYFLKNFADMQQISFAGTMETCRSYSEPNASWSTIASNLVNVISLAIPFAPPDNAEICTLDGRKIVDYQGNTKFLDTIFVLSAFMTIIFSFISWNQKHD